MGVCSREEMGAVFLGCLLKGPKALGAVPSALSPELGRKDGCHHVRLLVNKL